MHHNQKVVRLRQFLTGKRSAQKPLLAALGREGPAGWREEWPLLGPNYPVSWSATGRPVPSSDALVSGSECTRRERQRIATSHEVEITAAALQDGLRREYVFIPLVLDHGAWRVDVIRKSLQKPPSLNHVPIRTCFINSYLQNDPNYFIKSMFWWSLSTASHCAENREHSNSILTQQSINL
jgi:hypothetical protein